MFSSIQAYVTGALLLVAAAGASYVTHKVDNARYLALEVSYAKAQEKAVDAARKEQARLDHITTEAAQRQAAIQAKEAQVARQRLKEVEKYVKANSRCITYGLVRVLDAAVHGELAERLSLPAGKSNDACTTLTSVDLARAVSDNYYQARANAEQLNALIDFYRKTKSPTIEKVH